MLCSMICFLKVLSLVQINKGLRLPEFSIQLLAMPLPLPWLSGLPSKSYEQKPESGPKLAMPQ